MTSPVIVRSHYLVSLFRYNKHGVSEEILLRMRDRYERHMSIERIMANDRRRDDDGGADDEDRRCARTSLS